MDKTMSQLAVECGEKFPIIEKLENKNIEVIKAMEEIGITVLDRVRTEELFRD